MNAAIVVALLTLVGIVLVVARRGGPRDVSPERVVPPGPDAKAAELVGTDVTRHADPFEALRDALERHVCNWIGDAERDLDRIELEGSEEEGYVFVGSFGDTRRLLLLVDMQPRASVILVATKGRLNASVEHFGRSGRDIGNAVLVARLLHVCLFVLRSQGTEAVVNEPFNERLAAHYESMGFAGGRVLLLDDRVSLERTFAYVAEVYRPWGRNLASPPLPL